MTQKAAPPAPPKKDTEHYTSEQLNREFEQYKQMAATMANKAGGKR